VASRPPASTHLTVARAKPWGHYPDWTQPCLRSLAKVPNVAGACRAARISREAAYQRRRRDPAFSGALDDAIAESVDDLLEAVWHRAMAGSDSLMILLLKMFKLEMYGDRRRVEVTGANRGPIRSATEVGETDEEKAALKAAIRRELARRGLPVPD